uniref:Uncharacterized protein n=1 Tax=Hyaloperonospora arabidopsidis (strain Emoy2) TaxID=559515 RepID=M4BHT7_HYAAE
MESPRPPGWASLIPHYLTCRQSRCGSAQTKLRTKQLLASASRPHRCFSFLHSLISVQRELLYSWFLLIHKQASYVKDKL